MKSTYQLLFLFFICYSTDGLSQFCTSDNRFTEVQYFSNSEVSSDLNVVYATNVLDYEGKLQDLDMDIYYPSESVETLDSRPSGLYFIKITNQITTSVELQKMIKE